MENMDNQTGQFWEESAKGKMECIHLCFFFFIELCGPVHFTSFNQLTVGACFN